MPWKNGGGVTHEYLRDGEGPEGWAIRLSAAEVRGDGPFSRFPGIDRTITLLDGAGFVLHRSDGLEVKCDTVGRPFSFLGEDDINCTLVDGPVLDFNVMTHRGVAPSAVWHQEPGWMMPDYFLCLESGKVEDLDVEKWDLVVSSGIIWSGVKGLAVRRG